MPPPPPPPLAKRRASPGRSPRPESVLCRVHQPLRRPGRGPQKRGRPEQSPRYEPCLRYIFSGPVGTSEPQRASFLTPTPPPTPVFLPLGKGAPRGRRQTGPHPNTARATGGPGRPLPSAYRCRGSRFAQEKAGRGARTLAADLTSRLPPPLGTSSEKLQNAYFAESLLCRDGAWWSENPLRGLVRSRCLSQALPRPISPAPSRSCTSGSPGGPDPPLPSTSVPGASALPPSHRAEGHP